MLQSPPAFYKIPSFCTRGKLLHFLKQTKAPPGGNSKECGWQWKNSPPRTCQMTVCRSRTWRYEGWMKSNASNVINHQQMAVLMAVLWYLSAKLARCCCDKLCWNGSLQWVIILAVEFLRDSPFSWNSLLNACSLWWRLLSTGCPWARKCKSGGIELYIQDWPWYSNLQSSITWEKLMNWLRTVGSVVYWSLISSSHRETAILAFHRNVCVTLPMFVMCYSTGSFVPGVFLTSWWKASVKICSNCYHDTRIKVRRGGGFSQYHDSQWNMG